MSRRRKKPQDREFGIAPDIESFVNEYFPPVSRGDSDIRFCIRYGAEYKVRSMNQKYCSIECREMAEKGRNGK